MAPWPCNKVGKSDRTPRKGIERTFITTIDECQQEKAFYCVSYRERMQDFAIENGVLRIREVYIYS
jgi:hypothetical protein